MGAHLGRQMWPRGKTRPQLPAQERGRSFAKQARLACRVSQPAPVGGGEGTASRRVQRQGREPRDSRGETLPLVLLQGVQSGAGVLPPFKAPWRPGAGEPGGGLQPGRRTMRKGLRAESASRPVSGGPGHCRKAGGPRTPAAGGGGFLLNHGNFKLVAPAFCPPKVPGILGNRGHFGSPRGQVAWPSWRSSSLHAWIPLASRPRPQANHR